MSVIEHIPTEIVQLLSAADAAAYRLVPCGRDGDLVRFYGCDTKDYTDASEELEVLYGWQTAVEPIAEEDLQRLLLPVLLLLDIFQIILLPRHLPVHPYTEPPVLR